jgi:hypothetical protein
MLNFCGIVVAILNMGTGRNFGRHVQNGHHNTAQIQHCPSSTPFHMWVDYDIPN